ncbi:BPL-N domain-containing protein [Desulfovulcanus sp.]
MSHKSKKLFILWDESHLWGILLWRALNFWQLPVEVVTADQIQGGILAQENPLALLVPGGWAKLKSQNLRAEGRKNIRKFIQNGGKYLGFCGGAGLALNSRGLSYAKTGTQRTVPLLDLCSWGRKPMSKRLPNFSGHILCQVELKNNNLFAQLALPVWWPSQFAPNDDSSVQVLATYLEPEEDFWVTDLNLSDLEPQDLRKWEKLYKINLNPSIIQGEPCLIQGKFGQGEYILSYAHLETPNSPSANKLLWIILSTWLKKEDEKLKSWENKKLATVGADSQPALAENGKMGNWSNNNQPALPEWDVQNPAIVWNDDELFKLWKRVENIIVFGQKHFLLSWRRPWLLSWRRGIPGSHINFIYAMLSFILSAKPKTKTLALWKKNKDQLTCVTDKFCTRLKSYLLAERLALTSSPSSPETSSKACLQQNKVELLGSFPGYGGLYAQIINILDQLILSILRE